MSNEPPLKLSAESDRKMDIPGYPAPAEMLSLAEARGARKTAIRACVDQLEKDGPDGFGEQPMRKLANALGTLSEAVVAIDPKLEFAGLASTAQSLETFEVSESELRNTKKFWERINGKQTPLNLMLDRLEDLAKSMPDFGDPQDRKWKELGAAYQHAHTLTIELGDAIAAGRARMAKANADLKPAHDRTLEALPENRGAETEAALLALRAARDKVERRVHALRGTHLRGTEILTSVRHMAAAHLELRRQRKFLDARLLPQWEQSVAGLIRAAKTQGDVGNEADLGSLHQANTELAEKYRTAIEAGDDLSAAYANARAAVNQPQSDEAG